MFGSVLVVCVGNICRSPIGERVLSMALPKLRVGSAGLDALVGHAADATAAEVAARHGVDVSGHVARNLTADLGAAHDLILVMERAHRREIAERFPQLSGRTMLFGHWIDDGAEIPDPYGRAAAVHEKTVSLVLRAGHAWLARLGVGQLK